MANSSGGLPPIRGALCVFETSLVSQADTKLLKANPTLASGDVVRSIDGAASANMDTLPTVTPASGKAVQVPCSVAEMTSSLLRITFSDIAGAEWCDQTITIQPKVLPTVVAAGTAQAVASGTITLPAGTTGDWNGCIAHVTSASTGAGQARRITAYNTGTLVATVSPAWDTTPTGTITVAVLADEAATAAILANAAAIKAKTDALPADPADASDIAALIATAQASLATIAGYTDTLEAASTTIQGYVDTLESRLPAALDGGRMPAVLAVTPPTAAEIDTALTAAHGSGSWAGSSGGVVGSGSVAYLPEAIVDENADPVDGAAVWVTLSADPQGTPVAGTVYTQANGLLADPFQLDPGNYYLQISLSRYQHKTVAFEVEAP